MVNDTSGTASLDALFHRLTIGLLIFAGILFLIILIIVFIKMKLKNRGLGRKAIGRKAALYMQSSILPRSLPVPALLPHQAHGIIFGRLGHKLVCSPIRPHGQNGGDHVICIGPTGSGKTSGIVRPTLRSLTAPATAFVIDISGDISGTVHNIDKVIFDPEDKDSSPYNVFASVDRLSNIPEQNQELMELSALLVPINAVHDDSALYFAKGARKILTGAFIAFYHDGLDFVEICEKILSSDYVSLFTAIDAMKNPAASMQINSFREESEKNIGGCYASACDAVSLFATNDLIKERFRRPKSYENAVSPETLEETSVFVRIPEHRLDTYSPILHIITAQTISYLSARPFTQDTPILMVLDEFYSLKIERDMILAAYQRFRKRHVRIMLFVQSVSDLDVLYGKESRKSLINNATYTVILGARDPETQHYFSDMIGTEEVTDHFGNHKLEPLLTPSDLGKLGDDLILIYGTGFWQIRKYRVF